MSRTAFYCRCGERLQGAARLSHRCKPADVTPLGPSGCGLYVQGEDVHFDVPEFLHFAGWPDTPANRDEAVKILADVVRKALPGVPVIEQ